MSFMAFEEKKTIADVSDIIKNAVDSMAKSKNRADIVSVESMIPAMEPQDYPKNHKLDVVYGNLSSDEKLDIFYPETGEGPFPVFVEVHGGGWYFGQKRSVEFQPFLPGLERGYAVVSLGYTLSPKARFPQPVEEVKAAIRYLKVHAKELRLDPNRIALWGGSAGAHLAAMAAMSCGTRKYDNPAYGNMEVDSSVAALVLWYGCFDYYTDGEQREILHQPNKGDSFVYDNFLGVSPVERFPVLLREMNPENHITQFAPPTFFQHGLCDSVVPFLQSVHFYELLKPVIGADHVKLDLLPDCEHADVKLFDAQNVAKVYDFVDQYLK